MGAIRLENLKKSFGIFQALKTMDLDIADGEFMALLGPSGCGKSTTMNMIAGMEEPTSGRILFDGRDMARIPMGQRGVGFVFQNFAIFTHMSVRDNLSYGLRMRRLPAAVIATRVASIADLLQLGSMLDYKADRLSVNILQRVAIGRSAIMEPKIFLLDEPLSNVDASFRAVMRSELKQLQRQFKQTMVYVTHDQLEAMTMADRIAVMDHGVLQQVGTPLEVYNNPVNLFVARFIGAPGMNLVTGRPVETARGVSVDLGALGLSPPLPDILAAAARRSTGDVYYGFRPEQVEIDDGRDGLALPVSLVERIGARNIVHLGEPSLGVKAVFGHDVAIEAGTLAHIAPVAASVRLFDAASGKALGAGGLHG